MVFPPLFVGTLREHYLILFGAAGAIATVAGFIGAWAGGRLAARGVARSAFRELEGRPAARMDLEELRLLSQSVDAIAIEVERIAEAQRFVARVLVERGEPSIAAPPRRDIGHITPH
jgi:hypothetical protein